MCSSGCWEEGEPALGCWDNERASRLESRQIHGRAMCNRSTPCTGIALHCSGASQCQNRAVETLNGQLRSRRCCPARDRYRPRGVIQNVVFIVKPSAIYDWGWMVGTRLNRCV